jgi:hypothetical protein
MEVRETKSPRPIDADSAAALVKVTEKARASESVMEMAESARGQKAEGRRRRAGRM